MQDVSLSGGQKKTRYNLLAALGKGISKLNGEVIPAEQWNKTGVRAERGREDEGTRQGI
jgi:hypothetical protein